MKIIECPRDAIQGINRFIPTALKVKYINSLLSVGFDTIDFGSFVSPKAIPQMKDTADVLSLLDFEATKSNLLAIIANVRGANEAVAFKEISHLGYPLSISETFQQRNTKRSIAEAMVDLNQIQALCQSHGKSLVVYLSMGFGNPYGDPYQIEIVNDYVKLLHSMDVKIISLSDTIGVADVALIQQIFGSLIAQFPDIEFGAHLHSNPNTSYQKVKAVIESGCRRIDGAIGGFGGCPMAKDDLTGNMNTSTILNVLEDLGIESHLDLSAFQESILISKEVFH